MENITSFRDLKIWQNGLIIVKGVYLLTKKLPREELFGLVSQMRRSAVSIPSNIAEGRQRSTKKDFCQFLHITMGSLAELETQLIVTNSLYGEVKIDKLVELIYEERRMVSGMLNKLKSS